MADLPRADEPNKTPPHAWKGRGSASNPTGRFESVARESEEAPNNLPRPETEWFPDHSRTALASNDSPDIGFNLSLNPYRGCEHGCVYCYARPTHEYLGLSPGLDFETKLFVKEAAPELLAKELADPSYRPEPIAMSGVTDPYQPLEQRLGVVRRCLEVLSAFRNPLIVITKSALVVRDTDLLSELARHRAVSVVLSVTTLDETLAGRLEPRAARPRVRLEAIEKLSRAGIPTGVNVAPIVPGLTDHETFGILRAAKEAGATFAGYTLLRLPYQVSTLFEEWLTLHAPLRKEKVLGRLRELRGGKLNDPRFGSRMRGEGVFASQLEAQFSLWTRRLGYGSRPSLNRDAFRRVEERNGQLRLDL